MYSLIICYSELTGKAARPFCHRIVKSYLKYALAPCIVKLLIADVASLIRMLDNCEVE